MGTVLTLIEQGSQRVNFHGGGLSREMAFRRQVYLALMDRAAIYFFHLPHALAIAAV